MNFFRKKPPLNQRSQIAVIITFVIAVIILFIVVFINITKVSQVKTSTSTSADKAALGLASQIGSMSHYYAHTVLHDSTVDGKPEECSDWWDEFVVSKWVWLKGLVGIPSPGYTPSIPMEGSISDAFNTMSNFNALRESALFQAAISLQSDDVTLLPLTGNPGFFYEDVNNSGAFDAGEPQYDLSSIPQMRKQNKVDRFTAWYYTKRLPWVSDDGLKRELDIFISKLKEFVDVDQWDSTKEWNIQKASYTIEPAEPAATSTGIPKYRTTCTTDCPAWVGGLAWPKEDPPDPESRKIRIVTIDRDDRDSNNNYNPTGGFLKDKFMGLAERLDSTGVYGLTFCITIIGTTSYTSCGDINGVIVDLTEFLGRTKELLDLPLSERIKGVREAWFARFYDFAKHKPDRTSIDGSNDHDIYLRLTRDQNYLNTWITELEKLNRYTDPITRIVTGISKEIESKHGDCTWGQGYQVVSSCDTRYAAVCGPCAWSYCGESAEACCVNKCCHEPKPCAWEGIYYTCCQSPPVCSSGDLYGVKPGWCSTHGDRATWCTKSCSGCNVKNFNCDGDAKSFQGQLAYDNTSGLTEVGQAIGILQALSDDIAYIQMTITRFADTVEQLAPKKDAVRNQLVYAWKDKSGSGHLVSVKIEGEDAGTVTGYPDQDLPYITESRDWSYNKCRKLEDYEGSFKIITSHYDQDIDIAAPQWKLPRRQKPSDAEFDSVKLFAMVNAIQNTGKLNPVACCDCHGGSYCQSDIDKLLNNYAITSTSQAHYGFEKSGIYIMKTAGD